MPISADEFEAEKVAGTERVRGRVQGKIVEYLILNKDQAYTQIELRDACNIQYVPSVNSALHALERRGSVLRKIVKGRQYWVITEQGLQPPEGLEAEEPTHAPVDLSEEVSATVAIAATPEPPSVEIIAEAEEVSEPETEAPKPKPRARTRSRKKRKRSKKR